MLAPVPGPALLVGVFEALGAGCADGVAAASVFVVGGDVADGLVEAGFVVVGACSFELGREHGRVCDGLEVGVLAFDVAP